MQKIKEQLKKLFENNKLPQAILLVNSDLNELRSLAKTLASKILGTDSLDTHPDYLFIQPTSVKETRQLINSLSLSSFNQRVVILDSAENLNEQAINNLLKSIEEPDDQTYFIVTTSHEEKILSTLRSRMMVFRGSSQKVFSSEVVEKFTKSKQVVERLNLWNVFNDNVEEFNSFLNNLTKREVKNFSKNSDYRLTLLEKAFQYNSANVNPSRIFSFLALKW